MKNILPLALVLLVSANVSAQSSLPEMPGTIFWKVTAPSGRVSHILGTSSLNAEKLLSGIPDWESLVRSAKLVITTWEDTPYVEKVENIRLDVVRYTDLFTAQQLVLLDSVMPRHHFEKPEMTPPNFPLMLVAGHIKMRLMTEMNPVVFFIENAMEYFVYRIAKDSKIPISALDSGMVIKRFNFPDNIGNSLDYNHNKRMVNSINDMIKAAIPAVKYRPFRSEYGPKDVAYHFNDTAAYTALPELKHLLTERNEYWMPKLRRHLSGTACFVLLGIDHLKYKDGILNQLVASGFKVAPVAMNVR